MNSIGGPTLFAILSAFALLGGIALHCLAHKTSRRIPVRILRCFYAGSFICAGTGMLLLFDNLLRQS
jgi:hypothetical protein